MIHINTTFDFTLLILSNYEFLVWSSWLRAYPVTLVIHLHLDIFFNICVARSSYWPLGMFVVWLVIWCIHPLKLRWKFACWSFTTCNWITEVLIFHSILLADFLLFALCNVLFFNSHDCIWVAISILVLSNLCLDVLVLQDLWIPLQFLLFWEPKGSSFVAWAICSYWFGLQGGVK